MAGLLNVRDANAASEAARQAGLAAGEPALAEEVRTRYHATLDSAFDLLPLGPKPRLRHSGGWGNAERKAWNLATRLRDDAGQVKCSGS
jgi:hypothetical protein